jgi:hypothetical protein
MNRWLPNLLPVLLAAIAACAPFSHGFAQEDCYDHLTELVRSSDFPFRYVDKDRANLLIDNDSDGRIMAQLFFDTDGSGVIGWVRYDVGARQLMNISADLETPEPLRFDRAHALAFEACLAKAPRKRD